MKRFSIAWVLVALLLAGKFRSEIHRDQERNQWCSLPREVVNRLCGRKVVYLMPYPAAPKGDALLVTGDKQVDTTNSNFWPKVVAELKKRGVILHCSSLRRVPWDATAIIAHGLPKGKKELRNLLRFPKQHALLSIWEPPVVEPESYREDFQSHFQTVLTWRDDLAGQGSYRKFHIAYPLTPMRETPPFSERRLLTMIQGNKASSHPLALYTERRKLVEFFESQPTNDFTFYGLGWEPCGYRNYGGAPADKIGTLQQYRFCICYENCKEVPGYVTEKIFDCFIAGCVPVYWGAPNIEQYIPRDCFVSREDFASDVELYDYLRNMPQETYQAYLHHIQAYLQSDQVQVFSQDHLVEVLVEEIMKCVSV